MKSGVTCVCVGGGVGGREGVELELKARIDAENSRKASRIRTVRASRVYDSWKV